MDEPALLDRELELVRKKKLILLLDLDQTLLQAQSSWHLPDLQGVELAFIQSINTSETTKIAVRIRPGARWFLKKMSRYFTIYLVTQAGGIYAENMRRLLERGEKFIERIFHGDANVRKKHHRIREYFTSGDSLAVKVDDTPKHWDFPANLLTIPRYRFLQKLNKRSRASSSEQVNEVSTPLGTIIQRAMLDMEKERTKNRNNREEKRLDAKWDRTFETLEAEYPDFSAEECLNHFALESLCDHPNTHAASTEADESELGASWRGAFARELKTESQKMTRRPELRKWLQASVEQNTAQHREQVERISAQSRSRTQNVKDRVPAPKRKNYPSGEWSTGDREPKVTHSSSLPTMSADSDNAVSKVIPWIEVKSRLDASGNWGSSTPISNFGPDKEDDWRVQGYPSGARRKDVRRSRSQDLQDAKMPAPIVDYDEWLMITALLLKKIHTLFFCVYRSQSSKVPNVNRLMSFAKSEVLEGAVIHINVRSKLRNEMMLTARMLGADLTDTIEDGKTTHFLVDGRKQPRYIWKVSKCHPHVTTVRFGWLQHCNQMLTWVDENFFRFPDPTKVHPHSS